jgi:tRNA-(ms[2]io[6]A)-hydroxylase
MNNSDFASSIDKESPSTIDLPLLIKTPAHWSGTALSDPIALLQDHGHLERKAASNALALLQRWPDEAAPPEWIAALTSVAKDEVEHLDRVIRLLEKRGSHLSKSHNSKYANALRLHVRNGKGPLETVDRLLITSLIEARSCERFALLAQYAEDVELRRFYLGLWRSEAGHYASFLDLAEQYFSEFSPRERFQELLHCEAKIILQQEPGPGIHSGWLTEEEIGSCTNIKIR